LLGSVNGYHSDSSLAVYISTFVFIHYRPIAAILE
jgi:hypothetical protein